jgi:2-aminoadipate transaminase
MPPVETFPVDELIRCSEAALRRDPATLLQYGRSPGYKPLREWLARQHAVSPEQILVGNSSLEIFAFITQTLLRPGARAFVETPSYDRAITLLRRSGVQLVGIPLRQDGLDLAALENEVKHGPPALVYVIADFNNPMGTTTGLEKRARLAQLAQEYEFWIVEDAPYRALRYWGQELPSVRSLAPDRVLYLSSFSKTLAPGLRLGYIVGPAEVIGALANWAVDTYIGPVFPTQGLVYEYCQSGLLAANIERLKDVYRPRLQATLRALEQHLPNAAWTRPEGGFYVGVTLPPGCDMASLIERARDAGLELTDGRGFFPNPAEGNRFLRVPFCSVAPQDMDMAIARLSQLL